jgi:hypothetical protein
VFVGPAASAVSVVLGDRAALAVTVLRPCPPGAKMHSATGHTTRNIAAALLIRTERRQIVLGALHAETPLPAAKPVPGNRFPGRVEI